MTSQSTNGRCAQERNFYLNLLELAQHDDPATVVELALTSLVQLVGAREGYLEVRDGEDEDAKHWAAKLGCDGARADEIRQTISSGIMSSALTSGAVVLTMAANEDVRFAELDSVRDNEIESVLCAPIGSPAPVGVVYLQGVKHGTKQLFGEYEQRQIELFTQTLDLVLRALFMDERDAFPQTLGPGFEGIVGRSPSFQNTVNKLRLAAPLDIHILLSGPTGTGKTMLAQRVHALSSRRGRFIELNCAAIPATLFESELFGAAAGAHSTAREPITGKIQAAERGTLFLDEVGELSLEVQAKLLQFLQSRKYYALGSNQECHADVRVIAATNRVLADAVRNGEFREDLYYRLSVLEMCIEPLASRNEDILPLANFFAREASAQHGFPMRRIGTNAKRAIMVEKWPGNVRQLANAIERGAVQAQLRDGVHIECEDIWPQAPPTSMDSQTLDALVRDFKRKTVEAVLVAADWNVAESARTLGIARSHLYTMIRSYGIERT